MMAYKIIFTSRFQKHFKSLTVQKKKYGKQHAGLCYISFIFPLLGRYAVPENIMGRPLRIMFSGMAMI